ncbi:MAG: threonine/serine dehydratase [Candidatus Thorarchaeota archaeon]
MEDVDDMIEIADAYQRIRAHIKTTPMEISEKLSDICNGEVHLKLENQQHTGSFKVRGALSKMTSLTPVERENGIVTASSGNHAQGVAYASQIMGIFATIFVPQDVSPAKLMRLKEYDVKIVQGGGYNEVERNARRYGEKNNLTYISPYNDSSVIAGQGTIGLEIIDVVPEPDVVIVPVGGGGLIAGISTAIKNQCPSAKVLGVLTPGASTLYHSFKAGKLIKVDEFETLAEAFLGGVEEGSKTFDVAMQYVDDMHLVQEPSIAEAIRLLWSEKGQVVEGAGATSSALIMEQPRMFAEKKVVVIVSGGNIHQDLFRNIVNA